ncbi:PEP-CTERM sorting domain-containing protein [Roseateles sp.]|jgi:hypothetical protein|uniref:PEP-CTERM sorting domain-containing protein n=1 Tax=Roseateles sp. TaxID=1971397 RepID=UPI003BAC8531
MNSIRQLTTALALGVMSVSAFAASTVYTSSSSFLSQVAPGAYTETFNGLSTPAAGAVAFSGGGFSYSLFAPSDLYASGDFIGTSQIDEALTISFLSGNVYAVGGNFFATNIADAFQAVQISLSLSDGTTVSFTPTSLADSYRGFVSTTAITSLTISAPGQSLYAGLDNLTVAAAVPEPASWALASLGIAGLAAFARRRRA